MIGTSGDDVINGMGGDDIFSNDGNDILMIDSSYVGETRWIDMMPGDIIRLTNLDCEVDVPY